MNGKKNGIFGSLFKVAVVIILILAVLAAFVCRKKNEDELVDSYDQTVNILNNDFDTQFYLYGEDIYLRENVQLKRLESLKDSNLQEAEDINILIIGDEKGTCSIEAADLDHICPLINDCKLWLFYIGTSKFSLFHDAGVCTWDKPDWGEAEFSVVPDHGLPTCRTDWSLGDLEHMEGDPDSIGWMIMNSIWFWLHDNYHYE